MGNPESPTPKDGNDKYKLNPNGESLPAGYRDTIHILCWMPHSVNMRIAACWLCRVRLQGGVDV
jgi:hypothetical protein